MIRALVLGGAAGVWEEIERAKSMAEFQIVVATNHAGRDYEGEVDHWVSFHPNLFPTWLAARSAAGRPPAKFLWSGIHKGRHVGANQRGLALNYTDSVGGSSGLLATLVALRETAAERIVLCGIPMMPEAEHYDRPGAWEDAKNYLKAWKDQKAALIGKVRSMSGWTKDLLGEPDAEWML